VSFCRQRISTARFRAVIGAASLAVILSLSTAPRAEQVVTLFAAASTINAIAAVARAYEEGGGNKIRTVFAASSTLARQIAQGAPADLYLSANMAWMADLESRGAIEPGTRANLLGNTLVLIAPKRSSVEIEIAPGFPLANALGDRRLAMGDPAHVPAGIYAKAALTKLGVWPEVSARVAYLGDVRGVLAMVDRGEAAAGIVYASDIHDFGRVRVLGRFPAESHPTIVYPLAVVAGRAASEVMDFYEFLRGPQAWTLFGAQGFAAPRSGDMGRARD
jgi:molybdate transport system substrate-binding protein